MLGRATAGFHLRRGHLAREHHGAKGRGRRRVSCEGAYHPVCASLRLRYPLEVACNVIKRWCLIGFSLTTRSRTELSGAELSDEVVSVLSGEAELIDGVTFMLASCRSYICTTHYELYSGELRRENGVDSKRRRCERSVFWDVLLQFHFLCIAVWISSITVYSFAFAFSSGRRPLYVSRLRYVRMKHQVSFGVPTRYGAVRARSFRCSLLI